METQKINFPILYVEDDHAIREDMLTILNRRCSGVHSASNGADGWDLYHQVKPDIMIIDLKMPKIGGIELIQKVRKTNQDVCIIVTSAHSEKEDLLSSIHLNVNHYLIKPIDPKNLITLIHDEHIRRSKIYETKSIQLSPSFTYNLETNMLYKENKPLKMTKTENKILHLLVTHSNTHVSYDQLERQIWKDTPMTKYALRTHVMQLKKKLGDEVIIKNISGEGYILVL